jgi:uncharacterized membrane protein YdjX (TVP38/TMEM64 family)
MPALARDLLAYFGVMTASFSILSLPPPAPPTLYFARAAPPWALAAVATAAAAVSAVFDYHFVRRMFRLTALERVRQSRLFERFERWAKVSPFWTTVAFAALPLPFTLPRVLMPLSGYPLPRYVGAVALGRYPRIFVIASFGRAFEIPKEVLLVLLVGGAVAGGVSALVRHRRRGPSPTPPSP